MKKKFAMLTCASLIVFSAGCSDASNAVDNVKTEVTSQVQETAGEIEPNVVSVRGQTVQNVDEKFSIGKIFPGMTFDEAKKILGEPSTVLDHDEFAFSNGLIIEVSKVGNFVEEIKIRQAGVSTGLGISVGMTEKDLIATYGRADSVDHDDGKVEYKYRSNDRKVKIEFEIRNDIISEIKTKIDD